MEDVLYVWKKNDEQFMVSKLPLGDIYVKYTKTGNGCWIPDDGVVASEKSSEGVSSEVKASEVKASDNEGVSSEGVNKGTSTTSTTTSKQVKTSKELDITTVNCNSNYNPSDMPNMIGLTKLLSDLKTALTNAQPIDTTALFTEELVRHINIRFAHLECLLKQHTGLSVVIAGVAKTGEDEGHHNLGTGYAMGQWRVGIVDSITGKGTLIPNYKNTSRGLCYDIVQTLITAWCQKLMKTYVNRVYYGDVGIDYGMSNTNINVWGANLGNYNKSNIGGKGQAEVVGDNDGKKTNKAGAFGIITTPLGIKGWDTTFTKEKSPFLNDELIASSFTGLVKGGNKSKSKTKKRRN